MESLIERPYVQSVPKYNYDFETDYNYIDFDIAEYSKRLQIYIKEKNRILLDHEYRQELINKKKLIEQTNDENEKLNIFHKRLTNPVNLGKLFNPKILLKNS